MLESLTQEMKKRLRSSLVGKAISQPPFINDEELIDFTVKLTAIDKETVSRVLEAEFVFMRLKGVIKNV